MSLSLPDLLGLPEPAGTGRVGFNRQWGMHVVPKENNPNGHLGDKGLFYTTLPSSLGIGSSCSHQQLLEIIIPWHQQFMQMDLGRALSKLKPGAEKRNVVSVLKTEFWTLSYQDQYFQKSSVLTVGADLILFFFFRSI